MGHRPSVLIGAASSLQVSGIGIKSFEFKLLVLSTLLQSYSRLRDETFSLCTF